MKLRGPFLVAVAFLLAGCAQHHAPDYAALPTPSQDPNDDSRTDPATISINIEGEVLKPGHYSFPAGARLAEVIAKAGGLTEESNNHA